MGSKKDVIVGAKFGSWTVLEIDVKNPESKAKRVRNGALCQCDCGTLRYIEYRSLYDGRSTNCGCLGRQKIIEKRMLLNTFQPGDKFGKLTVLEDLGMVNGEHRSKCQCDCGNIITVTNDHLKSGHTKSCGCIRHSYGEFKVEQILKENNIPYIKEFTFSDLKTEVGGTLRFDFAIFKNNQLFQLIEVDGPQHERPYQGWFEGQFEKIKERDSIKDNYCIQNHIKLLRIKYEQIATLSLETLELDRFYQEGE